MSVRMFTEDQKFALDAILKGHNVVITGQAGTGKSSVLREAYSSILAEGRRPIILCTTGMACLQFDDCQCSTVHRWAGMMDGRYDNLTLRRLLEEDDKMDYVRRNVAATNVILIGEISMLSRKDFEQLEMVCRTLLDGNQNFGGIQLVASGDFYQLPPVANGTYGDTGQFWFESCIWQSFFVHRRDLQHVVRQSDLILINAIRETGRGAVTDSTDNYLKSLQRDLGEELKPLHLFASNFDASMYNEEQLAGLYSDGKVFQSLTNNGSVKHLKKILAPKFLHIKVGCPVMLLRNLGGKMMNGLRGTVSDFSNDAIIVNFQSINEHHSIRRYNFTVVDMDSSAVIAEREQFPLCLAYGITIHKSQGMTLDSVCIHCNGIFESGQLSVALGRCKHTSVVLSVQNHNR